MDTKAKSSAATLADFLSPPINLTGAFVPRRGQWCKFEVATEELHAALVGHGAHVAPSDKAFVGIFASGGYSSDQYGEDGKVKEGEAPAPPRIMVVTSRGLNVEAVVQTEGGSKLKNVFFAIDNPAMVKLRPLTDKKDYPPGRKGNMTDPKA